MIFESLTAFVEQFQSIGAENVAPRWLGVYEPTQIGLARKGVDVQPSIQGVAGTPRVTWAHAEIA